MLLSYERPIWLKHIHTNVSTRKHSVISARQIEHIKKNLLRENIATANKEAVRSNTCRKVVRAKIAKPASKIQMRRKLQ